MVRGVLLCWRGIFVGRKRTKSWRLASLCMFWVIWGERNKSVRVIMKLAINFLKRTFFYLFWECCRLYIGDGSLLLNFGFYTPLVFFLCIYSVYFIINTFDFTCQEEEKKDEFISNSKVDVPLVIGPGPARLICMFSAIVTVQNMNATLAPFLFNAPSLL